MKYGEIQAIIQLAVGLNVGIFALTSLSLPYKKKQKRHLKVTYKYMSEIEKLINGTKDPHVRHDLGVAFKLVEEKLRNHSEGTAGNWRVFSFFINCMVVAAMISIFIGMGLLYDSAVSYDFQVPHDVKILVGILYLPLLVGTVMNLVARGMAHFKIKEQNAIREEIGAII